jgi:hypothetical protein
MVSFGNSDDFSNHVLADQNELVTGFFSQVKESIRNRRP